MQDILKTVLVFVVGLLGGLLGASLIGGGSDRSAEVVGGTGLDAVSATAFKSLEERLMLLEREAAAQDLALADFDTRLLAATRREAAPNPAASAAALDPNGNPDLGALSLTDLPTGPSFDAAVAAVIQKREEEERAARELERAQRREERVARTVEQLTADLGLDARQAEVVGQALRESTTAREQFFDQFQQGGGANMDREAVRAQMTQIREAEIAKVGAVLTPAQVETYTRTTDFGGGRGQGGRGGQQQGQGNNF